MYEPMNQLSSYVNFDGNPNGSAAGRSYLNDFPWRNRDDKDLTHGEFIQFLFDCTTFISNLDSTVQLGFLIHYRP